MLEGEYELEDFLGYVGADPSRRDPAEREASQYLEQFFSENRTQVFFSRQLEVVNENRWFHWITNRAIRGLELKGVINSEIRTLHHGAAIRLVWHRSLRYYKREANRVVDLVSEYASPNIGAALGLQGEALVLDAFAARKFVLHGRGVRSFRDRSWMRTEHDLDFIFERDGLAYGVEVKNGLGYMDGSELSLKIRLCYELEITPVFAVRMIPKTWVKEIVDAGGFALILKYQLYPWGHRDLARRVQESLGLPVDSPSALSSGTLKRFEDWHNKRL